MLKCLHDFWLCVLDRLVATKPARFAVIMVAAVLAFLIVSEQGQDVVRALAERQTGENEKWQRILFFAGVLAWSVYAWYWARVMLRLAFPGVPGNVDALRRYRTWLPRWLGTLAAAGVALALWLAAQGYAQAEHWEVREILNHLIGLAKTEIRVIEDPLKYRAGEVPSIIGSPAATDHGIAMGDIDGDGDLDIAVAVDGAHQVLVYFQTHSGAFAIDPVSIGTVIQHYSPHSVALSDLDGDRSKLTGMITSQEHGTLSLDVLNGVPRDHGSG